MDNDLILDSENAPAQVRSSLDHVPNTTKTHAFIKAHLTKFNNTIWIDNDSTGTSENALAQMRSSLDDAPNITQRSTYSPAQ